MGRQPIYQPPGGVFAVIPAIGDEYALKTVSHNMYLAIVVPSWEVRFARPSLNVPSSFAFTGPTQAF
jgi:hypothetical protein